MVNPGAGGPSLNVMQTEWEKEAGSYFNIWFAFYASLPN